uniref:NADH dehydrogenase subunit 6 n=1 Tax=Hirudo medicinalis TaxID=6421 RepID=A0A342KB35_HIRME|nr:NADH dehydrogenase subunit 6 [Hirudo medicinalis]
MINFLCFTTTMLFINMMFVSTPIMMLMNILTVSMMLSYFTAIFYSNWFAYMIFLIYIGGMLIMFSYFVAISPNQIIKLGMLTIILFFTLIFLISFIYSLNSYMYIFNYESSFYMMYETPYMYMLILLITLLLIIMLIVVKLVNCSKGPLRPFK